MGNSIVLLWKAICCCVCASWEIFQIDISYKCDLIDVVLQMHYCKAIAHRSFVKDDSFIIMLQGIITWLCIV